MKTTSTSAHEGSFSPSWEEIKQQPVASADKENLEYKEPSLRRLGGEIALGGLASVVGFVAMYLGVDAAQMQESNGLEIMSYTKEVAPLMVIGGSTLSFGATSMYHKILDYRERLRSEQPSQS